MQDLNTINRLNYEAFAESIARYRAAGRYVIAQYEGLALRSIETFSDQPSAQAAFDDLVPKQHGGSRVVLFTPLGTVDMATSPGPVRDQSEDRKQPYSLEQLAALGRRSAGDLPDQTLNDYIARKSAAI